MPLVSCLAIPAFPSNVGAFASSRRQAESSGYDIACSQLAVLSRSDFEPYELVDVLNPRLTKSHDCVVPDALVKSTASACAEERVDAAAMGPHAPKAAGERAFLI